MNNIMKKLISVLAVIAAINTYGQEISLGQVTATEWNDVLEQMLEKKFYIKYNLDEEKYYLQVNDVFNKAWIELTENDIESIRGNLVKYHEWKKIAIENSTRINKVLPNGEYKCNVTWKFGSDWYYSGKWTKLNVTFKVYSQSETRHQLVIYSDDVSSTINTYIEYEMPKLYFDELAVDGFIEVISTQNIVTKIKEAQEQKDKDDLFK